jgi:IclR family pca regulon transcriptional regulator
MSRRSPEGTDVVRGERLQSLERGLAVLRAFTPESPALTISEVADRTGLTRATARRILLTLADLGYVDSERRALYYN